MTKILLVEDDKSLREIYGVRLFAEGYDIVSAGDGEEALAIAIKERPQLIVSDVMMPKISGFDMLDILRSTTETKDIKVIMMTALSSEDQRARGEQLGADRYLVKSQVGIEDVVRAVHEVLGDAPVSGAADTSQVFSRPTPRPPQAAPGARPQTPAPQPAAPAPAPGGLPQPTAPFSSPRPANLGDRIIHPLESPRPPAANFASLMDQELKSAGAQPSAAAPAASQAAPVAYPATPPQEPQSPVQPQPAPQPESPSPQSPPQPPAAATPPSAAAYSPDSVAPPEEPEQPPVPPTPGA